MYTHIVGYKVRFLRYKKARQNWKINYIIYMIHLHKFISRVSMLHYSHRKYEKLLYPYLYEEQNNEEQIKYGKHYQLHKMHRKIKIPKCMHINCK